MFTLRPRSHRRRHRCHLQVEKVEDRRLLTTITVTGAGDTIANDGVVTLREAITAANTNAASGDAVAGTAGLDTIDFDIPGAGLHTIDLTSPLSAITDPIVIDGFTQTGSHPNTSPLDQGDNAVSQIELNGSGAGVNANGLHIDAGGSTVRGLVIDRFTVYGIWLTGTGGDHIEGDFIGTDPTGLVAQGNSEGIRSEVADVTIGGPAPAQRNVISGNTGNGEIESRGDLAIIQGNYVGVGADGSTVLGSGNRVSVSGSSSTVGGTTAGEGNVIAAGGALALAFENAGGGGQTYHDGLVQGNHIGVNAAGTAIAGKVNDSGIDVGGWTNLTIGGTAAGAGNIIGGCGEGIQVIASTGILIQGNDIGTDPTGTLDLGNHSYGVYIGGTGPFGSDDNTIGGTAAGAGNLIVDNTYGVEIDAGSSKDSILGNTIIPKGGSPIYLSSPQDAVGGNDLQAAPVLTSVSKSGGSTTVAGTIDSTPDSVFTVQVYSSDTCCPTGFGPGQTLLGTMETMPSDSKGHVDFTFAVPVDIPDGQFLSATATDPAGNTSEFSLDRVVGHLIVTTANDDGIGSLRQAITCANFMPGTDTITFDIPGPGVHTIALASALPTITDPVIIDGYTQPGASPNTQSTGDDAVLLIELDGASSKTVSDGLDITAGNSVVRGLVIDRCYLGIDLYKNGGDLIEGDFIGTDAAGAVALSNGLDGVLISQNSNNTIGGTTPAARNIISGNLQYGVEITGGSGNLVQGNLIGTTAAGGAMGNTFSGVFVGGPGATIGGSLAGAGNTIAYNGGDGVYASAQGTSILSNTIANNRFNGVDVVAGAQGTSILSNSISSNLFRLGIDLGDDGVTPNDAGDTDKGANGLQNFPVITSATIDGGNTTIVGTLNSTPQSTFHLEFFGNDAADSSGFGEGQTFLGSRNVPTDPSGNASFTVMFPGAAKFVTATATDPAGNTSEFSQDLATTTTKSADLSVAVTAAPDPLTLGSGSLKYTLTVTNHGPDTATGAVLTDTLPGALTFALATPGPTARNGGTLTFDLGDLAGGATTTVTIYVTPTGVGALTDTADVSASNGPDDPVPGNNSGSATATVQPAASADLAIELAGPSDPVNVGDDLTYTILASNAGPSATHATLTDTLPAGVTFVSATGGVTPDGGILTFDLGTLDGGGQATVTIDVTPTAAGTLTDSAAISGSVADSDTSNNAASRATTVAAAPPPKLPDLAVAVSYDQDQVTLGQDVSYTIAVSNGGAAGATGVTLTDSLPPGVAFVEATGGVTPVDGVLTFDLGDLAGGGEAEVKVVVKPTAAGSLSTTAGVAANEPESGSGSDTATGSTLVRMRGPRPAIVHTEVLSGRDLSYPGQLHWYNTLARRRHAAPVWSVLVLLRPAADGPELTGLYQEDFPDLGQNLWFRYDVVRVWQQPPERLLRAGLTLLPLAPVSKVTQEQLPEVLTAVAQRLRDEADAEWKTMLWAATQILLGLNHPKERVKELTEGITTMILGIRGIEESSVYQDIFTKGRAEGIAEGKVEEARKILLDLGGEKFGPPDGRIEAQIAAITDQARLHRLLHGILRVSTWDELLAHPEPSPEETPR